MCTNCIVIRYDLRYAIQTPYSRSFAGNEDPNFIASRNFNNLAATSTLE